MSQPKADNITEIYLRTGFQASTFFQRALVILRPEVPRSNVKDVPVIEIALQSVTLERS